MKIIFVFVFFYIAIFAEIPQYDKSKMIEANGESITVGTGEDAYNLGFASPCVVDWNEDGKKDLLIGHYTKGRIRYYENIGENSNPIFSSFEYLVADGDTIEMPWG